MQDVKGVQDILKALEEENVTLRELKVSAISKCSCWHWGDKVILMGIYLSPCSMDAGDENWPARVPASPTPESVCGGIGFESGEEMERYDDFLSQ